MIVLKTHSELERMKKACRISAESLSVAEELIRPGITTREIDRAMHDFIVRSGAKPSFLGLYGFPASACISVNDVVIHGIPGDYHLQEGDIVSIDVGACCDGFHGDNAYTFPVGQISEENQRLLRVTQQSLYKGIEAAVIGNRIGDISFAVQSHVTPYGFGIVRQFVGHGVGKALHEDPEVPNFGKAGHGPRLVEGMTIAIEPMITLEGDAVTIDADKWTTRSKSGKAAAHFEHTIAITKDGPVILTKR